MWGWLEVLSSPLLHHFLRLMDLSNFVYPLGLAFIGLVMVLNFIPVIQMFFAVVLRNVDELNLARVVRWATALPAIILIPLVPLYRYEEARFYALLASVGWSMIVGVACGFIIFVVYQQNCRKLNDR